MKTWNSGCGCIELDMTTEQAQSVSHQGRCDDDAAYLIKLPGIKRQLDQIDNELMIKVLKEYGIWDNEELQDNNDNRLRLVWIAGGDIAENDK